MNWLRLLSLNFDFFNFYKTDGASFLKLVSTVELQWFEHLWNHENIFETGVIRGCEC